MILTECRFLGIPYEIRARDVVVMPDLGRRIRLKNSSAPFV
jgi:hypothetical protein